MLQCLEDYSSYLYNKAFQQGWLSADLPFKNTRLKVTGAAKRAIKIK